MTQASAQQRECPKCGGTTWIQVKTSKGVIAKRCECFRKNESTFLEDQLGIPKRHRNSTFDNFKASNRSEDPDAYNALISVLTDLQSFATEYPVCNSKGVMITGGASVGKTHLAVATMKRLAERGFTCAYFDYQNLIETLRKSFDNNPAVIEASTAAWDRLQQADVVVLDGIGEFHPSDWVVDTVNKIIKHIYNEHKGLIITTSLQVASNKTETVESRAPHKLEDMLHHHVGSIAASRLREHCLTIEMPRKPYPR